MGSIFYCGFARLFLILPLIELYEHRSLALYISGDFVPRFCRFVKVFWHYDIRQPQAQDGQNQEHNEPPRTAEFLVGLFAKKRYRKAILSDLAEDFDNNIAAGMSLNRAKRRYWAAALNSIGPQLLAAVKRIGIWGSSSRLPAGSTDKRREPSSDPASRGHLLPQAGEGFAP